MNKVLVPSRRYRLVFKSVAFSSLFFAPDKSRFSLLFLPQSDALSLSKCRKERDAHGVLRHKEIQH
jgi:hypothetical protein